MMRVAALVSTATLVLSCGVAGPGEDDDGGNLGEPAPSGAGGASVGTSGSGEGSTGSGAGGPGDGGACATVSLDPDASRPVTLMSPSALAELTTRMPCLDEDLRGILESPDTMFYDAKTIIPGYQDSFGDGFNFPVGMRPNTIQSNLINLAVPGGHGLLFAKRGLFHFPFGSPTGVDESDGTVVDFWKPPREGGELLPVVWWWKEPNGNTHRIEWMFPVGTVFGELLFIVDDSGVQHPFEIRTRTRRLDGWTADVFRPFPTAEDLASALETKRSERPAWQSSAEIDTLIAHARDAATLSAATLDATHFTESFSTENGAVDVLPALTDNTILEELLVTTRFRSVRDINWKQGNGLHTYAPTSDAAMSIVPRNYNAGLVAVNDDSCTNCHVDAGRPFKDFYFDIMAYGELWGEDEVFTWHPFDDSAFVNGSGDVVSFNDDNRQFRQDFTDAGVLVPYSAGSHGAPRYQKLTASWRGYTY